MEDELANRRTAARNEQPYRTTITYLPGEVLVSLPDDGYIKLTPEQARQLGGLLFIQAARAEGLPVPAVIMLNVED